MKPFINLSSQVINKLYITNIVKAQGKYYINMHDMSFAGINIFSFGHISSSHTTFEICEKKDKQDYDIITKFIEEIDK